MTRFLFILLSIILWTSSSFAACSITQLDPQFSAPGNVFDRIDAQWNQYFASKVDANNGILCNPTFSGTFTLTTPLVTGPMTFLSGTATGLAVPMNPSDAATKSYVDAKITGIIPQIGVKWATASAVLPNAPAYNNGSSGVGATLQASSGTTLTVDGNVVALNDRVLVKDQAAPAQNGVYSLTQATTPWVLTRVNDWNQASEMVQFSSFFVSNGTANAGSNWVLITAGPITVGTTGLVFQQNSASQSYQPDNQSLQLVGNVFSVKPSGTFPSGITIPSPVITGSPTFPAGIALTTPTLVSPAFTGTATGTAAIPVTLITGLAPVATSGSASDLSTGTLPVARLGPTVLTSAKVTCPNILMNGGVANGVTDNSSAWANTLAASPANHACIYLPAGDYSFNSQVTFTLSSNDQAVTVYGDGPDTTILRWPAGGGIRINGTANRTAAHFKDLTVLTGAVNTGIGIDLEWGTQHNNNMASSTFDRVRASGDVIGGGHYWSTAIKVNGISQVNFNSVDIWGQSTTTTPLGVNLDIEAPNTNLSFIYNIINSNFLGGQYGVRYGTAAQGLAVVNSNFTLNQNGIYVAPSTGQQAQLSVTNSQFDNYGDNILVDTGSNLTNLMIHNNLFYILAGTSAVHVKGGAYGQIVGNQINPSGGTLLSASAIKVENGGNGIISDNVCVLIITCVEMTASSSGWQVRHTSIDGTAGEIPVINAGSFNYITGFIQQPNLGFTFPTTYNITGAQSAGGLIELTISQSTASLVVGEVVMVTAPGLGNQPGVYLISSIPDSSHIILGASAFGGSLTSNGILSVMP